MTSPSSDNNPSTTRHQAKGELGMAVRNRQIISYHHASIECPTCDGNVETGRFDEAHPEIDCADCMDTGRIAVPVTVPCGCMTRGDSCADPVVGPGRCYGCPDPCGECPNCDGVGTTPAPWSIIVPGDPLIALTDPAETLVMTEALMWTRFWLNDAALDLTALAADQSHRLPVNRWPG